MSAEIVALEYIYPQKELTNDDLSLEFPQYDFQKFEKKVGINKRYIVSENETALTLAIQVVKKLFDNNKINPEVVDFILYCTQSPEYFLPTTACLIQNECGLPTKAGALDFNLGCSGYTYGLSLAKSLINGNSIKNILLVTSETYSRYINKHDRSNRSIFGDAATATLISYSDFIGIGDFLYGTDGKGAYDLIVKNGGGFCALNQNPELKKYGSDNFYTDNDLFMDGPSIFNFTLEVIPDFTKKVMVENNVDKDSVDFFIFHQANAYMLDFLRKNLKIDKEKFFIDLRDGGNTVSNTIPIAIKKHLETAKAKKGDKIILMGFGVGLSWCGGLVTLNNII